MRRSETFAGNYDTIRAIGRFVLDGAQQAGLGNDAQFQIELACDEASTNIIEHAYQGENVGPIHVSWEITSDAYIITLEDEGPPFIPGEKRLTAPPIIEGDELKIGGLGIFFIRRLMDEVRYSAETPTGNTLTLVKWLPIPHDESMERATLDNGVYLLTVQGRLDHLVNDRLETELQRFLDNHHVRIIVDLHHVTYINSSGLRILVSSWRKARQSGGDVVLARLTPNVRGVFELVGFDKLFTICDTVESAEAVLAERT